MIRRYWYLVLVVTIALAVVSCTTPASPPPAPTTGAGATALPTATTQPPTATTIPATATTLPTATTMPTSTVPPTATALPTATTLPTETSQPATATTEASSTTEAAAPTPTGGSGKVDLDKIFPPGIGKDLVLNNCTSCHSFVCVVRGQRTVDHWNTIRATHRTRVSSMSDDDYNALFAYLSENFNDQKPEPELPDALKSLGCGGQ